MASEITVNANLTYESDIDSRFDELVDKLVSPSSLKPHQTTQDIGTSEEAINLGELSALGWAMFRNLDPTNYIELRVSTGGAKFATLHADSNADGKGGIALLFLGSGAQVPFAIANTGACKMKITIFAA